MCCAPSRYYVLVRSFHCLYYSGLSELLFPFNRKLFFSTSMLLSIVSVLFCVRFPSQINRVYLLSKIMPPHCKYGWKVQRTTSTHIHHRMTMIQIDFSYTMKFLIIHIQPQAESRCNSDLFLFGASCALSTIRKYTNNNSNSNSKWISVGNLFIET